MTSGSASWGSLSSVPPDCWPLVGSLYNLYNQDTFETILVHYVSPKGEDLDVWSPWSCGNLGPPGLHL